MKNNDTRNSGCCMPFFLAPAEGFGISGLPVVAFTNIVFFYYFDGYLSRSLFCDTSFFG